MRRRKWGGQSLTWDERKESPTHPTDSARGFVEFSDTNTWQANLWSAGCFVIKPKYLQGTDRENRYGTQKRVVSTVTIFYWICDRPTVWHWCSTYPLGLPTFPAFPDTYKFTQTCLTLHPHLHTTHIFSQQLKLTFVCVWSLGCYKPESCNKYLIISVIY